MDLTNFSNQYIFPLILFIFIAFFLLNFDRLDNNSDERVNVFLDYLSDRQDLCALLEDVGNKEEFINKLLEMSRMTGHLLTAMEIEKAVIDATLKESNNYICLPIGCWQLS